MKQARLSENRCLWIAVGLVAVYVRGSRSLGAVASAAASARRLCNRGHHGRPNLLPRRVHTGYPGGARFRPHDALHLSLPSRGCSHPRAPTPATGRSNSALRLTRHRVKGLIVVNGSEPTGAPDPSSASPRAMYPVVPAHRPIVPTAVPALEGDSSPRPTCRNSRSIENSSQIHWNPVGRMTKLAAFFRGVCACGPALAR